MSINLDKSQAFDKLVSLKPYDVHSVSSERIKECSVQSASLTFNYACSPIEKKHIAVFQEIFDECKIFDKFTSLLSGDRVNRGKQSCVAPSFTWQCPWEKDTHRFSG